MAYYFECKECGKKEFLIMLLTKLFEEMLRVKNKKKKLLFVITVFQRKLG